MKDEQNNLFPHCKRGLSRLSFQSGQKYEKSQKYLWTQRMNTHMLYPRDSMIREEIVKSWIE